MLNPILVRKAYFDDDGVTYGPDYGMTYIEFLFERSDKEDFHVKLGKSGDHSNDANFSLISEKSAVKIASRAFGVTDEL